MWHFIFEKIPADRDVLLAVLDHDGFHALDFPCRFSDDGRWIDAKMGHSIETHRRIGASGLLTSTDRSSLGRPFLSEAPPVSQDFAVRWHTKLNRARGICCQNSNVTIFADVSALRLGISLTENI